MVAVHREAEEWPALVYREWEPTCTTLHLWTQIVGKARLARTPWINHSWHATFYPTARGLTTATVPYGGRTFQADFDFLDDVLRVVTSDGGTATVPLEPASIAEFHARFRTALAELELVFDMHGRPNEMPESVPFAEDTAPRPYDGDAVRRFWRALLQVERVFVRFRSGFLGKVSPVHLFWGSFDLAVTRFSGRLAPRHPGGALHLPDAVNVEAYSHEVSSAGFWPGGAGADEAAFYSYAYPEPDGYRAAPVRPSGARFDANLGLFLLPYAAVRGARDPDATLLEFLQSTYEAAADLGGWNRAELEGPFGEPGVPRRVGLPGMASPHRMATRCSVGRRKKGNLTPPRTKPRAAPVTPPVVPDRDLPITGGDLPEEPVMTAGAEEPESAAPARGEPPRESDETF